MDFTATTCDVCGTQKKETNHWFFAVSSAKAFQVRTADSAFSIRKPAVKRNICGEACSHKALSQWLQGLQDAKTANLANEDAN